MSRKSSKPKKYKKFLCVYKPEKFNLFLAENNGWTYGEIRKLTKAPNETCWIELNFDFEEEQVFY